MISIRLARGVASVSFMVFVSSALVGEVRAQANSAAAAPGTPATYVAMTGSDRWTKYFKDNYASPGAYFRAFGSGLGQQLGNAPPEWRQGAEGYFKRSGSQFAQFAIDDTIRSGLAAAAGLDTRYRSCECAGAGRRALHAIGWSFVTRNNEGKTRFDWTRLAGAYGSGFALNAWYPARFGPKDAFREGTTEFGSAIGGNILREFTPDIKRVLRLK